MFHVSRCLLCGLLFVVTAFALSERLAQAAEGDIRPSTENPRYWQHQGKPVLLLGGSVEDNLFQHPEFVKQLDLLKSVGGNYVRNTMGSGDKGNVWGKEGSGPLEFGIGHQIAIDSNGNVYIAEVAGKRLQKLCR